MRILFDSRQDKYKTPFGTLRTGESGVLHIEILNGLPTYFIV